MPTYKNVSSKRQALNNRVVEPGGMISSFNYIDESTAGLLKIDDAPFYNPVILSARIDKPDVISVPKLDHLGKSVDKYAIHFSVTSGEVKINYNSTQNVPALLLYTSARWNVRCFERNVEYIHVEGITDQFTLYIIIERLV